MAALVVALVPPVTYGALGWLRQDGQARLYAEHLAQAMAQVAVRQPVLWRYNAPKIVQAAGGVRAMQELGVVRTVDCQGGEIFSGDDLSLGSGDSSGPIAWSPVLVGGQAVAWVEVVMDHSQPRARTLHLALGSSALGLALGLFLFVMPVRVVRRQGAELGRTLGELARAEARLVEANSALQRRVSEAVAEVRALSGRVVSVQETERRRIATDLHDGVGQLVTGLRLELELVDAGGDVEIQARRARALALCDTILGQLRAVVRDLRPLELDGVEPVAALREHTERFEERTGVAVSFRHQGEPIVDETLAVTLLRIVQEALHNVARHAEATEVGVALNVSVESVTLRVEDDGRGFDPQAPVEGVGLRGMRERVALLGGQMSLRAASGEGVALVIELPGQVGVSC